MEEELLMNALLSTSAPNLNQRSTLPSTRILILLILLFLSPSGIGFSKALNAKKATSFTDSDTLVWPPLKDMVYDTSSVAEAYFSERLTSAEHYPVSVAFDPTEATLYILVQRGLVMVNPSQSAPRFWDTSLSSEELQKLTNRPESEPTPEFTPFNEYPRATKKVRDTTAFLKPLNKMAAELFIHRNGTVQPIAQLLFDSYDPQMMDLDFRTKILYFWDIGVGKVHKLHLDEKRFERIDLSYSHRNMYGHASTMISTGEWQAMGGYGNWTYKNILIYFSEVNREWLKVPQVDVQNPPDSQFGTLVSVGDGRIDYLYPSLSDPSKHFRQTFSNAEWSSPIELYGIQPFEEDPHLSLEVKHRLLKSGSFTVDPNERVVAYQPPGAKLHFIDLVRNDGFSYDQLVDFEDSVDPKPQRMVAFYSWAQNQWHLYNVPEVTPGIYPLVQYRVISTDEIRKQIATVFFLDPFIYFIQHNGVIITAFVFLVSLFGWVVLKVRKGSGDSRKESGEIRLEKSQNGFTLNAGDQEVELPNEESFQQILEMIHSVLQEQTYEIPIRQLDAVLFKDVQYSALKTRKRQKVIALINQQIKSVTRTSRPFLVQERNSLDRRQMILTIDRSFL